MWPTSTSRQLLTALLAGAAIPVAVSAQDGRDLDAVMCRNGLFATAPAFQLAQVAGEGRAYFLADMDGCPEADECRLPQEPYVLPGDKVVVSKLRMDHACAYFPNAVGGTAGYLPLDRLQLIASDTVPPEARWLGRWSNHGNPELRIERREGRLHLSGLALWHGGLNTLGHPVVHDGEIDGPLTLLGNRGRYDDGLCILDLTLLDQILIVSDNSRCGGLNVRFVDVLERQTG